MDKLAKILFLIGGLFIISGFLIEKKIKIPLGRLPGDIMIKKEHFTFYFPLTTSIVISIILTLIFSLLWRK
jgi:hypothetical protein